MSELAATIQTQRLLLRQPCEELADALLEYYPLQIPESAEFANRLEHYRPFQDPKAVQRYLVDYSLGDSPYTYYYTTLKQPKKILGEVKVCYTAEDIPEFSWKADKSAPRKGYATEAAQGVLQHLKAPAAVAYISDHNSLSVGLAKRLGMVEGRKIAGYPSHIWQLPQTTLHQDQSQTMAI